MKNINQATIQGNLGRDPEFSTTPNGHQVAKFSIATQRSYKDKSGEWQKQPAQWHTIIAFGKIADDVKGLNLQKGSTALVEGEINYRDYEAKDGTKRFVTEIKAFNVKQASTDPLDAKNAKPADVNRAYQQRANINQDHDHSYMVNTYLTDDDIPF